MILISDCAQSCPSLCDDVWPFVPQEHPIEHLDGFLLIVTTDGELFFSSSNVESFLGFHQVGVFYCLFMLIACFVIKSHR